MTKEAKILIGIAVVVVIGGILLAIYANPKPAEPGAPVDQQSLIRETSHMTKAATAKVNIVEFGDYQCPGCAAAHPILKEIVEQYKDNQDVNFVFRHLPLETIHPNATIAAEAAEAAAKQGRFWEMHAMLYEKQVEWSTLPDPSGKFSEYAGLLGLNLTDFNASVSQRLSSDIIKADVADIKSLKPELSTPTFYINGVLFQPNAGRLPTLDDFKKKIDEELAK